MRKAKILLYDIETMPHLGYVWGKYDQTILKFAEYGGVASFAWKELGKPQIHVIARCDFKSERAFIEAIWKILDSSDITIAHNGNKFDNRKTNTQFLRYKSGPPTPRQYIDTLREAKKYFDFPSYRLEDICEYLKIGKKLPIEKSTWLGCLRGEKKSWDYLKKYNKHDVFLLEPFYLYMRPWMERHPNLALIEKQDEGCPKCGAKALHKWGVRVTQVGRYQRYRCASCCGFCNSTKKAA